MQFPPKIAAGEAQARWERDRWTFSGTSKGGKQGPYSYVLEKEHGRKEFRKRLNKEDQDVFDRLFARAKFHTAAGVHMAQPYPLETMLMSIILEHEKMIDDILGKIKKRDGENELNQNKMEKG